MIVGIDPGAAGGIAWLRGGTALCATKMPDNIGGVVAVIRELARKATAANTGLM